MRLTTLILPYFFTLYQVTSATTSPNPVRNDVATSKYAPRCLHDEDIRCCKYLEYDEDAQRHELLYAGKDPDTASAFGGATCVSGRNVHDYDSCNNDEIMACCYNTPILPINAGYRAYLGKTSVGCFPTYFGLYFPGEGETVPDWPV